MNSEKAKEIKRFLQNYIKVLEEENAFKVAIDRFRAILTLINELESENERLKTSEFESYKELDNCAHQIHSLEDRITELEKEIKENPSYAKGYADGIKNTYEAILPQKLENFAERLKDNLEEYRLENEYFTEHEPNGNLWQMNSSVFCIEVTQEGGLVDETLKEFLL